MKCPVCNVKAFCFNDMLTIGYIALLYRCPRCNGEILVEYSNSKMERKDISKVEYRRCT